MGRKAKNLLLVSRHATSQSHAHRLRDQGQQVGCDVQLRDCDCADEAALMTLLEEVARTLPAIRGVVIGAMVLDVSVLLAIFVWTRRDLTRISLGYHIGAHDLPAVDSHLPI